MAAEEEKMMSKGRGAGEMRMSAVDRRMKAVKPRDERRMNAARQDEYDCMLQGG